MPDSTSHRDYSDIKALILKVLPADGKKVGNKSVRKKIRGEKPDLTDDDYWAAREELIRDGRAALVSRSANMKPYKGATDCFAL